GTNIEHLTLSSDDQNFVAGITKIFSRLFRLKYFKLSNRSAEVPKLTLDPFLPEIGLLIPKSLTSLDLSAAQVQFSPEALSEFFKNSKTHLVKPLKLRSEER